MKSIAIILLICGASLSCAKPSTVKENTIIVDVKPLLRLVFLQDVSKSTLANGIEIVSSKVFETIFNETSRDIQLYFGYVSESSTKKFIVLHLPSAPFTRPKLITGDFSFLQKKKMRQKHEADMQAYLADSVAYFKERYQRIQVYARQIDSISNHFRSNLTPETDLATAIANAGKVFNYVPANSKVENVLIMNSDGIDSYRSKYEVELPCVTIFVTAGKFSDKIKIKCNKQLTLQSAEEAIEYSLNHQLKIK